MKTLHIAALCANAALAGICSMTDAAGPATASDPTPAPATVSPGVTEWEFPNLTGKRSFDVALIPSEVRLDFLKGAARNYVANRLNGVNTRHQKDPKVAAWNAYDEATKADALQTVVPKPDGERPALPDYEDAYTRAIADLTAGNVRKQSAEPKARATKDPLVKTVTDVVTREVYESRRAADAKYSYLTAKKEVGADGIAYLNAMIDAKVAAGGDRAQLEKMRDTKYVNPAKAMLGLTTTKGQDALPSIL